MCRSEGRKQGASGDTTDTAIAFVDGDAYGLAHLLLLALEAFQSIQSQSDRKNDLCRNSRRKLSFLKLGLV